MSPPSFQKAVIKLSASAASPEGFPSRGPVGCQHGASLTTRNLAKNHKKQTKHTFSLGFPGVCAALLSMTSWTSALKTRR